jgi:hypothetical protein
MDHDIPENMYRPDDDDPEGWIHRDKLAKIENEELQAAGINLANARRTTSKIGRRAFGRDGLEEVKEQNSRPVRDEKRQRISSPVAEADEEVERTNWDLRNPEEIAEESSPLTPLYSNPVTRKTGSKIPILTSSPLPIPQERVDRDTPLPRKRRTSGSMSPDESAYATRIRPRGNSVGSPNPLDDAEGANSTLTANRSVSASKTGSPSKTKSANTSLPATTASRKVTPAFRKVSGPTKTGVSPGATTSPSQRPATRAGEADRPRTAVNRPEGDPPWLATMYKVDPRLPPDQQIIPTHARRQQQAQWNEEGAIPNTYDRDFSPLMVHPSSDDPPAPISNQPSPPAQARASERPGPGEDDGTWPLKPIPSLRSNASMNGRPGTSDSLTGGYSTMPKVMSPMMSNAQSPRMSHSGITPARLKEHKAEDVDGQSKSMDKGCGCCIVM